MTKYTLDELLWRHKKDFEEDFAYRDICFDRSIPFTKAESDDILNQDCRALQFEKMCFIIKYQKYDLETIKHDFISTLKSNYEWIAQIVENSDKHNDEAIEEYRQALHRSGIPSTGDPFVYRLKWLWEIQRKVKELQPGNYLILKSKVGFGKKWLAKDACANYGVFQKMSNKVYWINVSNCETEDMIYEKLLKLKIMMNNEDPGYKIQTLEVECITHKIECLRLDLRKNISENALIILCGVSNKRVLKAFDLGCKILVTTKNSELFGDILEKKKTKIEIHRGFERDECLHLFHKATKMPEMELQKHQIANAIYEKCKGHPFIIASIAKSFYDLDSIYIDVDDSQWRDWLDKLDNFEMDYYDHEKNITRVLQELPKEFRRYFESLYVFKYDANIPFKVLELYWEKNETEVKQIVNRFHKLSLTEVSQVSNHDIVRADNQNDLKPKNKKIFVCSLHFIYYSYLKRKLTPNEICTMNKNLIKKYNIEKLVGYRSEPKMCDIPDDNYFYYYIGYHLIEAKMEDLFPKLYFDFEFLEEKLRTTGLANTLGDLYLYAKYISDDSPEKENLLYSLMEFLKSIEETLLKSPDTCMLQYAFNSSGLNIAKEAESQILKYNDRVWFNDSDHSHIYRQVVQLPTESSLVKFMNDPNAAISVQTDNTILLKDLSVHYPVDSTLYRGHMSRVKSIELLDDETFVSLDESNVMKLWSLKRTAVQKRLSQTYNEVERADASFSEPRQRNYKSFDDTHRAERDAMHTLTNVRFKCMHFNYELEGVIAADSAGDIVLIKRVKDNLKVVQNTRIRTNLQNIHSLCYFSNIVGVLNGFGAVSLYNMVNSSLFTMTNTWQYVDMKPIGIHSGQNQEFSFLLCVYEKRVNFVRLDIHEGLNTVDHITDILYDTIDTVRITCSSLSDDQNYLMLGTSNGIKILNIRNKEILPCKNMNDEITSIDVISLPEEGYKHLLVSSTKKHGNFITLEATVVTENDNIGWANDRTYSPQLPLQDISDRDLLNKSLFGNTMFDVRHIDGEIQLILPDDKHRIQLRNSINGFKPYSHSIELSGKIIALAVDSQEIWIGCDDGKLFKMQSPMNVESIKYLGLKIIFLQHVGKMTFIGTTEYYYIFNERQEYPKQIAKVLECDDNGNVAVIHTDCSINMFNCKKRVFVENCELQNEVFRAAAVNKDNYLMIGLQNNHVYAYNLPFSDKTGQYRDYNTDIDPKQGLINCMALSADGNVLAVGFTNGIIQIIPMEKSAPPTLGRPLDILFCNESVNDLIFSPWKEDTSVNAPIILASLSQDICFWDIKYITNNPFDSGIKSPMRRSQRYRPPSQVLSPDNNKKENSLNVPSSFEFNPVSDNLWQNKKGPSDKPKILSCIRLSGLAHKLIANDNFTQFVTVDNNGEIYHLRLFEPTPSAIPSI